MRKAPTFILQIAILAGAMFVATAGTTVAMQQFQSVLLHVGLPGSPTRLTATNGRLDVSITGGNPGPITSLTFGAATTSGVRLDLESGALACREGDDSGYCDSMNLAPILRGGGTTSSFPMWKRSSATWHARLADDSDYADISVKSITVNSRVLPAAGASYDVVNKAIINTAPTISSGFGTSPSIVAHNGSAAFTINVGTGGSASTGVIGLPAATTGWAVTCGNTSTNTATVFITKQTAFTTTTATIGNYDAAGAAAAWVASNVLVCKAMAF